jgi:hypothetical protein
MMEKPNPGSPAAVALGCLCPCMENGHGKGAMGGVLHLGSRIFWMNEDCPLHGTRQQPTSDGGDCID